MQHSNEHFLRAKHAPTLREIPSLKTPFIWRRGHWKRGICIKLSEIDLHSRQVCNHLVHPSSHAHNEIPAILRDFGAQFATHLRNAPLANVPFSKSLIMESNNVYCLETSVGFLLRTFKQPIPGRPRFGSVTGWGGTVRAVPVCGFSGSSAKRVLLCINTA